MKAKRSAEFVAKLIGLSLVAMIVIFPFANLVMNSLKSDAEFIGNPAGWPEHIALANYAEVFVKGRIINAAVTSIAITFTSVIIGLAISSLAAFAITKMGLKHGGALKILFLLPLLLSVQVVVLPIFLIYARLGLVNTYTGAILIYVAHGLPLGILILANFLESVPNELCDAAKMDGASPFQVYHLVALPLLKTPLTTVAILNGLGIWNDFFVPFIFFPKGDIETLPLSILHFVQNYGVRWTMVFADVVYIVAPVLLFYIILQRYVVGGVTAGALVE